MKLEKKSNQAREKSWKDFSKNLPHKELPFSKRNWGGAEHSLCSFQGKMKPSLAHHLVRTLSSPGDIVVDPFSGSGTIPLEACKQGRKGIGLDISRLGYVLTMGKVAKSNTEKLELLLLGLERAFLEETVTDQEIERARKISFNSSITEYFHPHTLRQILIARRFFQERWGSGAEWALAFSCCAHILHGNRPYSLSRNSHPITPYSPRGEFEPRDLIPRLRAKLGKFCQARDRAMVEGESRLQDCTKDWGFTREANVVITSPPFFDSTRFYMTNWMRFWFLGWEREDFDSSTTDFVEQRQKETLDVYLKFFNQAHKALVKNGLLLLHLGHSKKCDMGVQLRSRSKELFKAVDLFYEGVEDCESHGISSKGAVFQHSFLLLEKRS